MDNYIYVPKSNCSSVPVKESFRCRVPLNNTKQFFVVDGVLDVTSDYIKGKPEGGYTLKVSAKEVVKELQQIISVREEGATSSIELKNSFELEERAEVKVLLCSHTLELKKFETNEQIDIKLSKNSILDLVVMQNEHNLSKHNSKFNITLEEGAILKLNMITLHGGEISNKIELSLNGKRAEAVLNGLYLADGEQKISTLVNVSHNVPECMSSQLFKGVLDGNSVTKFNGLIYVAPDAQKTEAYQANNNLVASDTAKVFTQPHLEIYADDVKCSHGATIGSLKDDELFYMRSRGIAVDEAKILQKQAFAYATLESISNVELKERLYSLVERRLRGEFSHCSNCSNHCC